MSMSVRRRSLPNDRRWFALVASCGHVVAVVADVDPPPQRPSDRDDRAGAKRYAARAGVALRIRPATGEDMPGRCCDRCPAPLELDSPPWTLRHRLLNDQPAPAGTALLLF